MSKNILVIGGTGILGQPVSGCLPDAWFQVRIMTRDGRKAKRIFDDSFKVFVGDPWDIACLEEAIHGCTGVHISLPSEIEQQVAEAVAQVASRHGVEHITYISGATVAEENHWFLMVNRKFLAEKAIRESGIPYTFLCPTWVMEGLALFVQQGRAVVFGKQPTAYHWVAAEDIARMVTTAYGLEEGANRRFIVHGPEAIRMHEALWHYCAVFHADIKEVSSMPFWLVRLLAMLTGSWEFKGAGELLSYFEKVGEGRNLPQGNCVLGTPAITLERWLQQKMVNGR